MLDLSISGDRKSPIVNGDTNLPDGTKLFVGVMQGDFYPSDSPGVVVTDGRFSTLPLMPGEVPSCPETTSLKSARRQPKDQPLNVQSAVGWNYQNLTRPGIVGNAFGRVLKISRRYAVPPQ